MTAPPGLSHQRGSRTEPGHILSKPTSVIVEFFRHIPCPQASVDRLQRQLRISRLPEFCASVDKVLSDKGDRGEIYCHWGQFDIQRLEIRHGVRFSLLNCPHALCWSITLNENEQHIIVHCTTDKPVQDAEFTESIDTFVDDWQNGIRNGLCPV